MHIARLRDHSENVQYGIPVDEARARRLEGDLFAGLRETSETLDVNKWLAPLSPPNIYCIGLSYRAHAQETGAKTPENPVIVMKPTRAITSHGDPILPPAACERGPEVDYEAELTVVTGRTAKNVAESEALDYVLGYTCANDKSARKWQKHGGGGQWIRGKSSTASARWDLCW